LAGSRTRNVVGTGGGTGIGRAIAAAFAQDGNAVAITGRRPDVIATAAEQIGGSVTAVPFDAADPAQIERALPELPATVDVLVNTAGGNTDHRQRHRAGFIDDTEFFRGRITDERRQALIAQTATGRGGRPADIAATVLFLASPGAPHITGQVIHVNGGALSR
jgi:3-oxoacyl-[acyl-carrier protein] reductase